MCFITQSYDAIKLTYDEIKSTLTLKIILIYILEDFCGEYIKNELEGKPNNFEKMIETIKIGDGARFFDPEKQSWSPQKDFELCLDLNRFDFVLKVEKEGELNFLRRINI